MMRNQDPLDGPEPPPVQQASDNFHKSYHELCCATDNWAEKLGDGGEGAVYRGKNPANLKDKWAVKVLFDKGDARKFELEVSASPPVEVCDTLSLTHARK